MIIDAQNHFNKAAMQAVTVSAASTDLINQTKAGTAYGAGSLMFVARVGTAFTATGAGTLNIQIQTATDEAFSSPIVLYDSGAIAKTALTANTIVATVDISGMPFKQYIRVYYVVGTGPMTAGTIEAFFTPDARVA
jgi:hypothetical protein